MASVMDCSKEDPAKIHRIILSVKTARILLHMSLKSEGKSRVRVMQGVTAGQLQTSPCSSLHDACVAIRV